MSQEMLELNFFYKFYTNFFFLTSEEDTSIFEGRVHVRNSPTGHGEPVDAVAKKASVFLIQYGRLSSNICCKVVLLFPVYVL